MQVLPTRHALLAAREGGKAVCTWSRSWLDALSGLLQGRRAPFLGFRARGRTVPECRPVSQMAVQGDCCSMRQARLQSRGGPVPFVPSLLVGESLRKRCFPLHTRAYLPFHFSSHSPFYLPIFAFCVCSFLGQSWPKNVHHFHRYNPARHRTPATMGRVFHSNVPARSGLFCEAFSCLAAVANSLLPGSSSLSSAMARKR